MVGGERETETEEGKRCREMELMLERGGEGYRKEGVGIVGTSAMRRKVTEDKECDGKVGGCEVEKENDGKMECTKIEVRQVVLER